MSRLIETALIGCLSLTSFIACDRGLDDDERRDVEPPVLKILEPDRGTIIDGDVVTVAGRVFDDVGVELLRVNGRPVEIAEDGSFTVEVRVGPGMALLQTEATDADGNAATDTRGILAGIRSRGDQEVADAMRAELNAQTFEALGTLSENIIKDIDFEALGDANNPLASKGVTCAKVSAELEDVQFSDVSISVTPTSGALYFEIELYDLDVDMRAHFSAACIPGSTGIGLDADMLRITGSAPIELVGTKIVVDFENAQTEITELDINLGALPSELFELVDGFFESQLEKFITKQLEQKIPETTEKFLEDFTGQAKEFELLGETVGVTLVPSALSINEAGGLIAANTRITVNGDTGEFVATPEEAPKGWATQGFGLALADDALNQGLASMWAGGMLDREFVLGEQDDGDDVGKLGKLVDIVETSAMLPPSVETNDDVLRITLGDLLVNVVSSDGVERKLITQVALSATLELAVDIDENNQIHLVTKAPTVWVDVIEEGVGGANILADDQIEALASIAISRVGDLLDELLGAIPVPSFGGMTLREARVDSQGGYLLVGGKLSE